MVLYRAGKHLNIRNATYGICGTDMLPSDVLGLFAEMRTKNKHSIRVGVKTVAPEMLVRIQPQFKLLSDTTRELIVYAIGSDGTIGAIRNAMKVLD